MKGYFVCLEKKRDGEIFPTEVVEYDQKRGEEYLKKIRFYLPQMLPLINGEVQAEDYPGRTLYAFNCPCGMCDYRMLCLEDKLDGLTYIEKKVYRIPYLSPTELIKWETCPRQWAYHRSGLSSALRAAKQEFGSVVHDAVEAHVRNRIAPPDVFVSKWDAKKDLNLQYSSKENHGYLREVGISLMKKFPEFWKSFVKEKGILSCSTETKKSRIFPGFALNGRPDIVCNTRNDITVIDWKVISKKYDESWVKVSDQMTGYFLLVGADSQAVEVTYGDNNRSENDGSDKVLQGVCDTVSV